jgi:hypothetical protein
VIDERDLFERAAERFEPSPDALRRWHGRRTRRERNRRLATAALALVVSAAVIAGMVTVFDRSRDRPASEVKPRGQLEVRWTGTVPHVDNGVKELAATEDGVITLDGEISRFAADCNTNGASCRATDLGFSSNAATLADGVVYSAADRVVAISASCTDDCSPLWTASRAPGSLGSTRPLVADGTVFVPWETELDAFPVGCRTRGATCEPAWRGVSDRWMNAYGATLAGHTIAMSTGRDNVVEGFSTFCSTSTARCRPAWTAPSALGVPASVGADGLVYVSSTRGLYAYNDGCRAGSACEPLWTARSDVRLGAMAAGDGMVFASAPHHGIFAFERDCTDTPGGTCTPAWIADAAAYRMAVAGGTLIVSTGSQLLAYPTTCASDGSACEPAWTASAGPSGWFEQPLIAFGQVFVASGHHLDVFSLECRSDGQACSPSLEGTTHGLIRSTPVVSGRLVYVGTGDSEVVAFDLDATRRVSPRERTPVPLGTLGGIAIVLVAFALTVAWRRRAD